MPGMVSLVPNTQLSAFVDQRLLTAVALLMLPIVI
jgi:hypothetical protein